MTLYRVVPHSRRPRAILIGDGVVAKFADYVVGNVLTSLIAGVATFVWCFALDIPYPLLLGALVAIVDLFTYGSTVGGIVVALGRWPSRSRSVSRRSFSTSPSGCPKTTC